MLGGGQLGRYALLAARTAGYRTLVLDPDRYAPAGAVADLHLVAPFDDRGALDALAAECAVVTTEFENPPAASLARLAARTLVAPPPAAVAIAQDRVAEKSFLGASGAPTGPWATLTEGDDLDAAARIGDRVVVKTARLGYDGKGQVRTAGDAASIAAAWAQLGGVACVVERELDLERELSVVVARTADGAIVPYAVAENVHRDGILDLTVVPARIDGALGGRGDGTRSVDRRSARVRRRARRRAVRRRRHGARQRAGPAPAQQRPLDARRRGDEPVRPAGARRHRGGPRWRDDDRAGRRDGQPARRSVVRRCRRGPRRRAPVGGGARRARRPPAPVRQARPGAPARWATSPSSATTRRPPPSGRSPCRAALTAG